MNLIELERALHQLRLGGIAAVLETRLRQAQTETMAPIDLISWCSDQMSLNVPVFFKIRQRRTNFQQVSSGHPGRCTNFQ